nr:hypothetical protein CFP56_10483 [Quercus suber]
MNKFFPDVSLVLRSSHHDQGLSVHIRWSSSHANTYCSETRRGRRGRRRRRRCRQSLRRVKNDDIVKPRQ